KPALYAVEAATQLARRNDSEIILLNVVESPGPSFSVASGETKDYGDYGFYTVKLIARTKLELSKIISQPAYQDVKISPSIHVGNAYKAIAKEIAEQSVDLVVMGSNGSDGWEETLVGSNAEKVVRYAKCPVLVIKDKVEVANIKDIAFAANFWEQEDQVIIKIKTLQEALGAQLHLVKINTPTDFSVDHATKQTIEQFAKKYQLQNYTVNVYNDQAPEEGIISFAAEIKAQLIALATHGRTGLGQLFNGSIAEGVVNHAKRPVWTCRI
ncbi:MAG: universal stress protein, partial [Cyclobacteriaceae bacterium]